MSAIVAAYGLDGPDAVGEGLFTGVVQFFVCYPAPETATSVARLAACRAQVPAPLGERIACPLGTSVGEDKPAVGTYEAAALVHNEGHPLRVYSSMNGGLL